MPPYKTACNIHWNPNYESKAWNFDFFMMCVHVLLEPLDLNLQNLNFLAKLLYILLDDLPTLLYTVCFVACPCYVCVDNFISLLL